MAGGYIIGMDYGTDSVRTVIVDGETGEEISSHVSKYKMWGEGRYCDPSKNQFRQHPRDYIDGLVESVNACIEKAGGKVAEKIVGIGIDTTGSTPAPVDEKGTVLAFKDDFSDDPDAMFILWKDHTAVEEAEDINRVAKSWGGVDVTKYVGGVYSSEWFWSKILHVYRYNEKVRKAAFSWVEHADWLPALLTGNLDPLRMKRSRCAAGHKAMWHKEWGGLPQEEFLVKVDPLLGGLRDRLYTETHTSDQCAGYLTEEWASKLGLRAGIPVAVGAFDAHMGAVGSEIKEKTFVMILGTSACDMAVAPYEVVGDKLIEGICGQVDGSIIPGMVGLEAGQSSFGDVYAWFRDVLAWSISNFSRKITNPDEIIESIVPLLSERASRIKGVAQWPVAIDWLNGRRTPYADQRMKGAIAGLTLGTDAPAIFKALVESTAYGAKAIIDRFQEEDIRIDDVVASGGIPKKSPFVMQVLCDVLEMPVRVANADQAGALGASMFGAVVAGLYKDVSQAQKHMGQGFAEVYRPRKEYSERYREIYSKYLKLGSFLERLYREVNSDD